MPGRAKPAGYVERKDTEVEGDEGERDDGSGADARVGDIDLRLGFGGQAVLVICQADTLRWGIWSRISGRV